MNTIPEILTVLARCANIRYETGYSRTEAMDMVAQNAIDVAQDAAQRRGTFQDECTTEELESAAFYGSVGADVMDGNISRPSVGNVRMALLDAMSRV